MGADAPKECQMRHLGRAIVILATGVALSGCAVYPAPYYGYPGYPAYAGSYYAPYGYVPGVIIGGGGWGGRYDFHDGRR